MSVDFIHIHEDDEGMRSLHPLAAQSAVSTDMAEAAQASERNRAPDGAGWTDIHIIEAPDVSYADLGLKLADVVAAMPPEMPRVKRFYSTASCGFGSETRDPYGSYNDDAWCFGFGAHCYLKLEVKGELLTGVWYEAGSDQPTELAALRQAFEAIDRLAPSMVADYWNGCEGAISDKEFLDRYFAQLAETEDDER